MAGRLMGIGSWWGGWGSGGRGRGRRTDEVIGSREWVVLGMGVGWHRNEWDWVVEQESKMEIYRHDLRQAWSVLSVYINIDR